MNPFDKEELKHFYKIINQFMPIHNKKNIKIPTGSYNPLPKNLMECSNKVDNKFLNNNLHTIEEMEYRKKGSTNNFKDYQNKIYSQSEILNHDLYFKNENKIYEHDLFFKYKNKVFPKVSGASNFLVNTSFFVAPPEDGATIEVGAGAPSDYVSYVGTVVASATDGTDVVSNYYDQVAFQIGDGSGSQVLGSIRLGIYDGDTSQANNRYVTDSGSFSTTANAYVWRSLTEFQLATTTNWIAMTQGSSKQSARIATSGNNGVWGDIHTGLSYGALPSALDASGFSLYANWAFQSKMGHS